MQQAMATANSAFEQIAKVTTAGFAGQREAGATHGKASNRKR